MSDLENENFHYLGDQELSHSMVHYLFAIHKLKENKGYARVTDIAKELGITKGSVSTAVNNLKKKNLVEEEEDSKFLSLTATGHEEVHQILSARTLLFLFLKDMIGVDEKIALRDSCQMEHLMGKETREKLFEFMRSISCKCTDGEKAHHDHSVSLSLDLCQFSDVDDFVDKQSGALNPLA